MGEISTIGLDLAKSVFQVHAVDEAGRVVLRRELEPLEDVSDVGREGLDVAVEVGRDVVLIAEQLLQVQLGGVVEGLPRLAQQEGFRVHPLRLPGRQFCQHSVLGRPQHAIEAAQHGERQNDLAVVGLLVVPAQEVGHGPEEGRKGLLVQRVASELRVPRDDGHRFHGMTGTDSTRSRAVIPRDRGQV